MSILKNIHGHEELKALTPAQREVLCREIREFLVSRVSKTGGHLASNLGVVELSVAIETVFNTAYDRLVFDVGHQSYVHKMLTDRQAEFDTLRQFGGMSGFPKPKESKSDAFVAGHASSSVSIALGMARARTLQAKDYHVVALMGDGAATGGIAYEGLNDAAVSSEPMIVILNDNAMSIDHNVGGLARHLSNLRTKVKYLEIKEEYRQFLLGMRGGRFIYRITRGVKERIRRMLIPTTIFESMGFDYLGPVDGHDVERLIALLRVAKELKRPVLIHVMTKKGYGYVPAEENPRKFHGIGKFDPATGEALKKDGKNYSDVFGETMCDLAQEDSRVCAITAAMPGGTGLLEFKKCNPNRLFDVGIAEEHAVSMAGGLAKQGMVPVVALYSTFLQRSYDMILQDVCMLGLHVVFAIDRAGLVGEDGETHHGVFDIGFLRQAPNMTILCPASFAELKDMLRWAVLNHNGPVAVRYPRGAEMAYTDSAWGSCKTEGLYRHKDGKDITLVTYGRMVNYVMVAAEELKRRGIDAQVVRLLTVAPLPAKEIAEKLSENHHVVVIEETGSTSGVYAPLACEIRKYAPDCRVDAINLGKDYVPQGTVDQLYDRCGLTPQAIADYVQEVHKVEN